VLSAEGREKIIMRTRAAIEVAVAQHSALSTRHFTPREWAIRIGEDRGIVDAWLGGAMVLDPTCGRGDLLLGLMAAALARGLSARELPIGRLFGVEREPTFLRELVEQCRQEFGVEFPRENLHQVDFLRDSFQLQADAVFGNPPWANFADLSEGEKIALKPLFVRYGLVPDRRRLLLGGSRVDVAALVVVKSIADHLKPGGVATFFLPLSLLTGDAAHAGFRRYVAAGVPFAITDVVDLSGMGVFPGVATRYGAVSFQRDAETCWPIPWRVLDGPGSRWARPLDDADGPLAVADSQAILDRLRNRPRIAVPPGTRPRQGVNPCGASRVLFVRDVSPLDNERAEATSAAVGRVVLPRRFLYPLLTADQFDDPSAPPRRWVLLPHDSEKGQPLTPDRVASCPELAEYLERCRPALENRRGQWLRQWIDRGRWWALLGVGPYCFAPYRVSWPAYGATRFGLRVFAAPWQGQQALHAHIPFDSREAAESFRDALSRPEVEEYLRAFGTAGTRNFAQPGRVARILEVQKSSQTTT
jgi:SAM-dependent methyltransferase